MLEHVYFTSGRVVLIEVLNCSMFSETLLVNAPRGEAHQRGPFRTRARRLLKFLMNIWPRSGGKMMFCCGPKPTTMAHVLTQSRTRGTIAVVVCALSHQSQWTSKPRPLGGVKAWRCSQLIEGLRHALSY